jgi:RNA polymerase sigma factor (sigma-70 family)
MYDVSTLVGATEGKKAQANPAVTLDSRQRARAKAKRDALVADHIDLVPPIARSVLNNLPPSFELDDLIATGNLALVDAAERFRPSEHGCAPFSSYARHRIRGAILDSIKRRHYRNATLEPAEAAQEPARAPVIETEIDNGRLRERVQDAISWLPEREQRILREYYSPAEPDLRAVGAVLEITRRKAKQLHLDGIRHLRERLRTTGDLKSVA